MKIVIIADSHFGARQDSLIFNNYFMKFYSDVFFPYLDKHNISTVFHLGDVFDRRKYVNFNILNSARSCFFDELQKRHIDVHLLMGNHDCFHKNNSKVNSMQVLNDYKNITCYNSAQDIELDGLKMCMCPWINDDNSEETHKFLADTDAKYLFGHFEIKGCEISPGIKYKEGLKQSTFKKFKKVLSGHFHHRNTYGNIQYVGSPYQITYTDLKDGKGFCVFDTDTGNVEFHKNPYEMFYSIDYDDELNTYENLEHEDFSELSGCYVKIIVVNKTNPYIFDRFMDAIEDASPAKITVIENISNYDVSDDDIVELKEDTITIINKEVDDLIMNIDKDKLKSIIKQLYIKALDINK